jgi:hypothetical protein
MINQEIQHSRMSFVLSKNIPTLGYPVDDSNELCCIGFFDCTLFSGDCNERTMALAMVN